MAGPTRSSSDSATVSSDSLIGLGAHICAGSSVTEKSESFGDFGGHVEIIKSKVSGGSEVNGYSRVISSTISHTEVNNKIDAGTVAFVNSDTETTTVSNVITTDTTNSPFGYNQIPPIWIYGKTKIVGTAEKPIQLIKSVSSVAIGDHIFETPNVIVGPSIGNLDSSKQIQITNGAIIQDSSIHIPDPMDDKYILPGVAYAGISISGDVRLTNSSVYISGSVTGNSVLNDGHIYYSNVSNSSIRTSYIGPESNISSGSSVFFSNLRTSSLFNTSVSGRYPGTPLIDSATGYYNLFYSENFNESNKNCFYSYDSFYQSYLMKCFSKVATVP